MKKIDENDFGRKGKRHGSCENNKPKRFGFGILLLIVGLVFILRNFDLLSPELDNILISWQMLVISNGFVKFLFDSNRTAGAIMMMVGGFFIVPEIFDVSIDFFDVFWPLLLIGAGLIVIVGPGKRIMKSNPKYAGDKSYIEEMNIFGGNEKVMEVKEFKGGSITNIFGGTELDLRDCEMIGNEAEIELLCVFGGVEMRVPEDWEVVIKVAPIFGGFSNKRFRRRNETNATKTLYISGTVVFGGGEIK